MRLIKSYLIFIVFITCPSIFGQIERLKINTPPLTSKNTIKKESVEPKKPLTNSKEKELIHSGDLIEIDIIGSSEYDYRGKITPEGFINGLKFVDNIFVQCKTEEYISKKLEDLYSKFLRNPQIRVKILDKTNRPSITLIGEIKLAQRFLLKRKIRLNELIILSGGLTEKADGEIQILRQKNLNCLKTKKKIVESKIENGELNKEKFIKIKENNGLEVITLKISDLLKGEVLSNPEIFYGDIITVKGTDPLYVIGGVNNPGKILFREKMTLSRAIASAGGLSKEKNTGEVRVLRREGIGTKIINVNLNEIKNGKIEDLKVQPFDVIDVVGKDSKRKFSPIVRNRHSKDQFNSQLPLRVID